MQFNSLVTSKKSDIRGKCWSFILFRKDLIVPDSPHLGVWHLRFFGKDWADVTKKTLNIWFSMYRFTYNRPTIVFSFPNFAFKRNYPTFYRTNRSRSLSSKQEVAWLAWDYRKFISMQCRSFQENFLASKKKKRVVFLNIPWMFIGLKIDTLQQWSSCILICMSYKVSLVLKILWWGLSREI